MKKHVYLFICCLLPIMLSHADAIQQEVRNHAFGNDAVVAQDADRAVAELSALPQDEHVAEIRSLCGKRNCVQKDCCGCTPKNDCCTKLQCRRIITTLNVVESKVCLLTECEPIPLSQSDVVDNFLTIEQPGLYCLATDISGIISIQVSEVTLDLNCHTVTAVTAPGASAAIQGQNVENVFVTNGIVDGDNVDSLDAVAFESSTNIQLSHLTIKNASAAGIELFETLGASISDVLVMRGSNSGCTVLRGGEIFISNSVFENCGDIGIRIGQGAQNVVVRNCHAISCGCGFEVASGQGGNTEEICFLNCTARSNRGVGFLAQFESGSIILSCIDCVAANNEGDGFRFNLSSFYVEGCVAQDNTGDGFGSQSAGSSGVITQCKALRNGGNGFFNQGASSVRYTSNYATGNGINDYSPNAGPPFNPFLATDAGLSFWYNTRTP